MKRLKLPDAPPDQIGAVKAWADPAVIPTDHPPPDKNPMFLEKRVYLGSSGRVYRLPFTDRISTDAVEHAWQAVHLENELLRVVIADNIKSGDPARTTFIHNRRRMDGWVLIPTGGTAFVRPGQ